MKSRCITIILLLVLIGVALVMAGMGGSDMVHGTRTPPVPTRPSLEIAGSGLLVIALFLIVPAIRASQRLARKKMKRVREQKRFRRALGDF